MAANVELAPTKTLKVSEKDRDLLLAIVGDAQGLHTPQKTDLLLRFRGATPRL
jgi:hypothetical protein